MPNRIPVLTDIAPGIAESENGVRAGAADDADRDVNDNPPPPAIRYGMNPLKPPAYGISGSLRPDAIISIAPAP
jgi:hypothetical protein